MCVAEVGFPIERAVGESLRGFRKQRDFFLFVLFFNTSHGGREWWGTSLIQGAEAAGSL